jgi:hypothetical protein
VFRKLVIAAAAVLVIVVAIGAHLWREATALPDWYTQAEFGDEDVLEAPPLAWVPLSEADDVLPSESPATGLETARPAPSKSASPRRARERRKAARHELRGFHRRGHKSDERSPVKASRALYEDGRLQAGVIVDLSRIPREKLVRRDRELYDRAVEQFPGITKRDVYIGIEDRPTRDAGVLQLGPTPRVRVGNLKYSLEAAARKIGMTPSDLRRELDLELHRLGFVDPTESP